MKNNDNERRKKWRNNENGVMKMIVKIISIMKWRNESNDNKAWKNEYGNNEMA